MLGRSLGRRLIPDSATVASFKKDRPQGDLKTCLIDVLAIRPIATRNKSERSPVYDEPGVVSHLG